MHLPGHFRAREIGAILKLLSKIELLQPPGHCTRIFIDRYSPITTIRRFGIAWSREQALPSRRKASAYPARHRSAAVCAANARSLPSAKDELSPSAPRFCGAC